MATPSGEQAPAQLTSGECPMCHHETAGVNDRYRCQTDETLWSTNPTDGDVAPIIPKK